MTVVCWGRNDHGQLGVGDNDNRHELKQQKDLRPVALGGAALQIVAGETPPPPPASSKHICVLTEDNELKCWGSNDFGQLGLGDRVSRGVSRGGRVDELYESKTTQVGTGYKAYAVSAGESHTMIRMVIDTITPT
ncbi:regulator of chromosome condensation 1/beta-lactamase-inhibitor protein II [Pavlovales sp. CCMP2436]|nr:regulator of chromosome condensation 1/beta-lactamase-inhibitor protein II [Pavlovales sp. CCMP2436]